MRVLLIGASGLIGSHVLSRLHLAGHAIVAVGRDIEAARRRFPAARWVRFDLSRSHDAEAWALLLGNADAVVNCAGVLQDSPRDHSHAVHMRATAALADACVRAGIRRFVHVSAAGVGPTADTAFGRTKHLAEEALKSRDLDWVILRPGLVLGPTAYGGSALLRGLAGLPFVIPLVHAGQTVQIIALSDLTETIARILEPAAAARVSWTVLSPERTSLAEIVTAIRTWLGLRPVPVVPLPGGLAKPVSFVADALAHLGWRSPLRTTAIRQLAAGVTGDPGPWMLASGIAPLSLAALLGTQPSGVEARWFARTYFLKPLGLAVLGLFWTASGAIALGPSFEPAVATLAEAGLPAGAAAAVTVAGALVDIALGLAVAWRRAAMPALIGMIALSLAYLVGGTILRPELWLDPLGVFVKVVPGMFLALFVLAVMDER